MLEEVVRQLSHDLKLAETQRKATSSSSHAEEDAVQSMKGSPATQREMQALSARVRSDVVLTRTLCSPISKQTTQNEIVPGLSNLHTELVQPHASHGHCQLSKIFCNL